VLVTVQSRVYVGILQLCTQSTVVQLESKIDKASFQNGSDIVRTIAARDKSDRALGTQKLTAFQTAAFGEGQTVSSFCAHIEKLRTTIANSVTDLEPNMKTMVARLPQASSAVPRLRPCYETIILQIPNWEKLNSVSNMDVESQNADVYERVRDALEYSCS